jgi:hypothetical protein
MSYKAFKVEDQYRTNPLSNQPGGSMVTIYFENSKPRVYDKIKSPMSYILSLSRMKDADSIIQIDIDDEMYWERTTGERNFF